MTTSTFNIEAVTRKARELALALDKNPKQNDSVAVKREIQKRAFLEGICGAVYMMTDEDTWEKFMDVVWTAEVEGK